MQLINHGISYQYQYLLESKNSLRYGAFQNFENQPDIIELNFQVRSYLWENTPTLGHGYSHLKRVAHLAYQLAIDNDLAKPNIAYIAGLLHDIYRPAQGQAGKEQHEDVSVQEARKILAKTKFVKQTEEVVTTILNHDQAIVNGTSTKVMEILSIADKIDMTFQRVVAYGWASNQFRLAQGQTVIYKSFEKLRDDFGLYQKKAERIFRTVKIIGLEAAIEAYRQTNEHLDTAVQHEKEGKVFWEAMVWEIVNGEMQEKQRYWQ